MSADNEGALGKYRPKAGDRLLGEQLLAGNQPDDVFVDQVEIGIDAVIGDRVKVTMTSIAEGAIDTGSTYPNEAPLSDFLHSKCGIYEITKKLGEPDSSGVECDWRALAMAQKRGIVI